ncbi:hypothetical protein F4212_02635 [Candidatus Poribacteria bacterium]|nr:hypothetical protein [Gammaproteobacteria bacterium]MYF98022.1 hypothetical protein [Candidatus Poribacteria bacterium]
MKSDLQMVNNGSNCLPHIECRGAKYVAQESERGYQRTPYVPEIRCYIADHERHYCRKRKTVNNSAKSRRIVHYNQLPPPSNHTMFALSTSQDAQVPINRNPIRFAVLYRNGCTSNAWGVTVKPSGDAYIYCRDNMKGQEISLHASGRQHISIDPNTRHTEVLTEKQFTDRWHEPGEGIATFRLIFPYWGIQLNQGQRNQFQSTWDKNDVYIEGHHEFLTVVSFYIVNDKTNFQKQGGFPGFLLGELPLIPRKKLGITAEWQPEQDFKDMIENAMSKTSVPAQLWKEHSNRTLAICMSGNNGEPNSKYMVTFPVVYSPPATDEA